MFYIILLNYYDNLALNFVLFMHLFDLGTVLNVYNYGTFITSTIIKIVTQLCSFL